MRENPYPVAVVTGAGADIGASVARRLAAQGYAVAVVDKKGANLYRLREAIEAAGGQAQVFIGDVGLVHEAEAVMTRVVEELGEPAVLVNNSSVLRDSPFSLMTEEDWDVVQRAGLRAPFLLSVAARRYMVRRGWGRIVNIGPPSPNGQPPGANTIAATRGLEGLTRSLAMELGPYGVTVNAVVPGFIATEAARSAAERLGLSFEVARHSAVQRIPVGRIGTAEDVAESVAFFASEAAGFISGQVLHVAGGPM